MKSAFAPALFALPHLAAPATAKEKEKSHEESLLLFDQRRVGVNVPAGFLYSASKDEHGVISARLSTPKDTISLQISFLPDVDGEYATARGQKEIMVKSFQQYVVGSVEQGMHFEELQPRNGSGTYCIFTDAKLVGAATLPPGEYLHSTTGIKSWRGCMALFTLFSNNTTSEEYLSAMKVLRESVVEKPLTPLR